MDSAPLPSLRFLPRIAVKRLAKDGTRLPVERFSSAWSPAQAAARLRAPGHTLVEFMQALDDGVDVPTKLYFDADRWAPDPKTPPSEDDADAFLDEIRGHMGTLMDTLHIVAPDATYVLAQRHGFCKTKKKHKLSLRAFVVGVAISRHDDIPRMLAGVRGLDSLIDAFDMSVYKTSEQLIAAIHGRKGGGDDRVLLPLVPLRPDDPDTALLDYVVQHVDPDWPVLDGFREHEAEEAANASKAAAGDAVQAHETRASSADADDPVVRLVRCLGPRTARDRAQWINVGIALKHALGGGSDRYLPAYLDFSSLAGDKYDGDVECTWRWRGLRSRSGVDAATAARPLSIGTLIHYAKVDNPVAFRAWLTSAHDHKVADMTVAMASDQSVQSVSEQSVRKCVGFMLRALSEDPDALTDVADAKIAAQRLDVGATLGDGRRLALSLDLQNLKVTEWDADGKELRTGLVHGKDAIDVIGQELGVVHKHLKLGQTWQVSCPGQGMATFTTKETHEGHPRAKIDLVNMHTDAFAKLEMTEARRTVTEWVHKKHLPMLQSAYQGAMQHALEHRMGMGWALNIVGDNNNVVNVFNTMSQLEDERGRTDGLLVEGWVKFFTDVGGAVSAEERGALSIVYDRDGSFFFCERGLWVRTGDKAVAANQLVTVMKSVAGGRFWDGALTEAERRYIDGLRGRLAVLMCMLNVITDTHFERRLDARLDLVPFDNGVVELATRAFRVMRWDDYVTKTIGYEYVHREDVPASHFDGVLGFYERVLPVPEEREVFLRAAGAALSGDRSGDKFFLVLTDQRGGNNGKSTLLECVAHVFGSLSVPSQANFLYASNNESSNSHGANDLHYKGRRLAVFDETTSQRQLNTEKIKRITGGGLAMAVRGANDKTPTEFVWTAVVMIGCNEGNMPQFSASEAALLNRMIVLPFRAKFDDIAAAAGEEDAWPVDPAVRSRLRDCRAAHFHVLLDAHGRYKAGAGLGRLPASCVQWREAVAQSSDPRAQAIAEFIDANVDFNLKRTDGQRGHRVLGSVQRTKLVAAIKAAHHDLLGRSKVGELKALVDAAMVSRGRKLCDEVRCGGALVTMAYRDCALRGTD